MKTMAGKMANDSRGGGRQVRHCVVYGASLWRSFFLFLCFPVIFIFTASCNNAGYIRIKNQIYAYSDSVVAPEGAIASLLAMTLAKTVMSWLTRVGVTLKNGNTTERGQVTDFPDGHTLSIVPGTITNAEEIIDSAVSVAGIHESQRLGWVYLSAT